MTPFLLSQLLLVVTIACDLASFQFKRREIILFFLFIAAAFNAMHFYLLEQTTAACLMAFGSVRYFIGIFVASKKAAGVFILLSIGLAFYTYSGIASLLSFAGSFLKTVSVFSKSDKSLRLLMMVGTVFWILNNAVAHSPLGVLMESLFLISNVVAYYRYYWTKTLYKDVPNKSE